MARYVIGDIHGCAQTLQTLLEKIRFDPAGDRLWLVGDLVNRGPGSLEVLRWARDLGERVVCVLGNHDLKLLSVVRRLRDPRPTDTFERIIQAPDADDLLEWLLHRPLVHQEGEWLLVHAGILPAWSGGEISRRARRTELALRSRPDEMLQQYSLPWPEPGDGGEAEPGYHLKVFTRLRVCRDDGTPLAGFTAHPSSAPPGCKPWFSLSSNAGGHTVFGHWSTLGVHRDAGATCLDSGCAWGGPLTALRLEDGALFQAANADLTSRPVTLE